MSLVNQQIEKAERRSAGLNLRGLVSDADKVQGTLGDDQLDLRQRRDFLSRTKADAESADVALERIVAGNELQDVNYFQRGARAAGAVGRIIVRRPNGQTTGYGTGFLIAPGILLTNNHVLPDPTMAERSELEMEFERDIAGKPKPTVVFDLRPTVLFATHASLDFSIVAVSSTSTIGGVRLDEYGYLPLIGGTGKAMEGEWLSIIQHPK